MKYAKYSPEEVASRGEEIYQQRIRPLVEDANQGKFVIIDIETENYELDESDARATQRALAKRPSAVLYGIRIGHPTTYQLGAHATAKTR